MVRSRGLNFINPEWNELLSDVDEAWRFLDSRFMHPNEEPLLLATTLGVRAVLPPS